MNDRFNKTDYIRLIDRVLDAYTDEHIRAYTESVQKGGIKEHGYPRLTANLGIVIAHGYRRDYTETFREMMELCCDEVGCARQRTGRLPETTSR